jgi:sugar lactone lactonase YvrE
MTEIKASVEIRLSCDVGEGPCWDDADGSLIFVDITPGRIFRYRPASGSLSSVDFGQEVGAAIPTDQGGLVVAARDGIYLSDHEGKEPKLLADIESSQPSNRMNDAKCDPQGRLWAGTMAFDFAEGAASLYRIGASGVERMLEGLTISNGLGWSPDAETMYFIDSGNGRVDCFDFRSETGAIDNRRAFTEPLDGAMPDGLTVDREGGVWVAFHGSGSVRRFSANGELTAVVELPVSQVTSCCFGGEELGQLFITTAAWKMSEAELRAQPLAGSIFVCSPGVGGSSANRFATHLDPG